MTDREIIEWVAAAAPGDALPFGVSLDDIMLALERAGAPVYRGIVDGGKLSVWARVWLAEHPAEVQR